MEHSPTFSEAIKALSFILGSGGFTLIVVALINRRKASQSDAASPPPATVPIETPWLIQTLTRIQFDVEGIKDAVDANTAAISTAAVQMNTAAAAAAGRRRRRKRPPV